MMIFISVLILISVYITFANMFKSENGIAKMIYLNSISSYVLVLICLIATLNQTYYLIDVAIVYALVSFIGTAAVFKYIKERK